MVGAYIDAAMHRARYELIDDGEPYYGEVPELEGVWATARTFEECRQDLMEVVEGWILLRLHRQLPIPPLGQTHLDLPAEQADKPKGCAS